MNKIQLLDKDPVYAEELSKADTDCATAENVIARLCDRTRGRSSASLVPVFVHLAHVKAQPDGKIAADIKNSRHVIFCRSTGIPSPLISVPRPRAIWVPEFEGKFVISFLEAPVEAPNQLMAGWVKALRKGSPSDAYPARIANIPLWTRVPPDRFGVGGDPLSWRTLNGQKALPRHDSRSHRRGARDLPLGPDRRDRAGCRPPAARYPMSSRV